MVEGFRGPQVSTIPTVLDLTAACTGHQATKRESDSRHDPAIPEERTHDVSNAAATRIEREHSNSDPHHSEVENDDSDIVQDPADEKCVTSGHSSSTMAAFDTTTLGIASPSPTDTPPPQQTTSMHQDEHGGTRVVICDPDRPSGHPHLERESTEQHKRRFLLLYDQHSGSEESTRCDDTSQAYPGEASSSEDLPSPSPCDVYHAYRAPPVPGYNCVESKRRQPFEPRKLDNSDNSDSKCEEVTTSDFTPTFSLSSFSSDRIHNLKFPLPVNVQPHLAMATKSSSTRTASTGLPNTKDPGTAPSPVSTTTPSRELPPSHRRVNSTLLILRPEETRQRRQPQP
jgi:hypothetical protein